MELSSGDKVAVDYFFVCRTWLGVMLSLVRVVRGCLILTLYDGDRLVALVWCGVQEFPLAASLINLHPPSRISMKFSLKKWRSNM
jgi:hypothetical protein